MTPRELDDGDRIPPVPHWPDGTPADPLPAGQEYLTDMRGTIVGLVTQTFEIPEAEFEARFGRFTEAHNAEGAENLWLRAYSAALRAGFTEELARAAADARLEEAERDV